MTYNRRGEAQNTREPGCAQRPSSEERRPLLPLLKGSATSFAVLLFSTTVVVAQAAQGPGGASPTPVAVPAPAPPLSTDAQEKRKERPLATGTKSSEATSPPEHSQSTSPNCKISESTTAHDQPLIVCNSDDTPETAANAAKAAKDTSHGGVSDWSLLARFSVGFSPTDWLHSLGGVTVGARYNAFHAGMFIDTRQYRFNSEPNCPTRPHHESEKDKDLEFPQNACSGWAAGLELAGLPLLVESSRIALRMGAVFHIGRVGLDDNKGTNSWDGYVFDGLLTIMAGDRSTSSGPGWFAGLFFGPTLVALTSKTSPETGTVGQNQNQLSLALGLVFEANYGVPTSE
jgi:hypothetical protein